jgi:RHS repeat-associated protein
VAVDIADFPVNVVVTCEASILVQESWHVKLRRGLTRLCAWLGIVSLLLFACSSVAKAQSAEGDLGWQSFAAGVTKTTAAEACRAQWQYFNGNPYSRFIGAFPTDNPNRMNCLWTQFQYLCPEETGQGISGCGTTSPGYVERGCAAGYSAVASKYCAKAPVPERGCGASNNGGQENPAVGNPFILSTGCKILRDEDYATADGQLEVSRSYRSLPIGASESFRTQQLGLAGNWTFDFAHEIQLGGFSGSPSAPNAKLALVAPNGTAYDFAMQSGGAIAPNAATGAQYVDKNIKIEYVGTLPASLGAIPASSSQWKMTDEDETVWTFNTFTRTGYSGYSMGRPISKVTKENYRWDFVYATDGALQTITDSFGRQLLFSWNYFYVSAVAGSGSWPEAVKSVTLPDSTSIRYTYDPPGVLSAPSTGQVERLVKVEHLSSTGTVLQATGYNYTDTRHPWHITGITRTDGATVASYTYDARGRGLTSALAGNVNPYAVASSETATEALRSVTGPLGKVDEYRFAGQSSPTQYRIAQVDGLTTPTTPASTRTISYGADNFISSKVDEEGRTVNFTRDARGNATSTVEAVATTAARTTGVTIHPTLNLPTQEVRTGLTINYTYDTQGKMLSRSEVDTTTHTVPYATSGQTRTWTYNWSPAGRLLSINGPKPVAATKDDTLTFTYSPLGNLLTSTNGLGHVTTFAGHDGNGRPATMTDLNGIITAFTYDALGRTTIINVKHPTTAASNAITTIDYDNEGRVIGVTAPATDKMFMDYNVAGQLTAMRAASGERIDYLYNAAGGVTSEITKRTNATTARSVTRTFDALNRMLTQTLGPNRTTTYAYDKVGNATQMVSARNNATQMAFDGLDRLVQSVAPDTGTSTSAYSVLDDVTAFTDAKSVATTYVRNGFGDMLQETSPDRGTSVYYYDAAGAMTAAIDGRGQRIDTVRDILGRVTKKTPVGRPVGEVITYSYDSGGIGSYQKGRLTKIVDGSGTTSFQYDHRGNMLVKRQALGSTTAANLTYAYNLADQVTQITYPSGRIVGYVRDSKQRVTTVRTKVTSAVTAWTNLATSMQYEPFAALKQATLGNTLSMTNNWGNDGRLASRRLYKTTGGVNQSLLTYAYDNDDNITGITDGVTPANTVTYAYDSMGRLNQVSLEATSAAPFKRTDYAHDTNSNRTSAARRVNAADVSAAQTDSYALLAGTNRLASITTPSGTRSITPDARGNMATETRPSGVTVSAGYDGYARLTSYASSGTISLTHLYNGLDDRVATATTPSGASADTRRFVTAPDGRAIGEYGASGTDVRAEFIWFSPTVGDAGPYGGDDGGGGYMPLAVAVQTATPGVTALAWVHSDHLGTPIVITDATGTAIAQPTGYTTPAFPGQSKTLADLYYNRYRDYDPTTGRYIQADPIGLDGGSNPYLYAEGNPVRYMDPSGLFIDTIADVGFVLYDLYRIGKDNIFGDGCEGDSLGGNLMALGLDAGAIFVPFVTGAGPASRAARNADDLAEQAADLVSLNGGRNRVTIRSPSQQMEVDLAGKAHGGVPTPHTKVSPLNPQAPNQPAFNTRNSPVTPATQQDIRTVRRYLERQN